MKSDFQQQKQKTTPTHVWYKPDSSISLHSTCYQTLTWLAAGENEAAADMGGMSIAYSFFYHFQDRHP